MSLDDLRAWMPQLLVAAGGTLRMTALAATWWLSLPGCCWHWRDCRAGACWPRPPAGISS